MRFNSLEGSEHSNSILLATLLKNSGALMAIVAKMAATAKSTEVYDLIAHYFFGCLSKAQE